MSCVAVRRLLAGLLFLGSFAGAPAQPLESALTSADFVQGFEVVPVGDAPVQVLELPLVVYRGSQQAGLADLRVFAADGSEVPHAVLDAADPPAAVRQVRVPFFGLGDPVRLEDGEFPGDLRLRLEQPSGTTLELRTADLPGQRKAVLLDLRAARGAVTGLAFDWRAQGAFALALEAQTSRDLAAWSPLGTLTLARPVGERQERSSVPLPPTTAPYLRLRPFGDEPLPPLRAVSATVTVPGRATLRRWLTLSPSAADQNRFTFGTDARLRVDRARLRLPQANTLVDLELLSASSPASEGVPDDADPTFWTRRFSGVVYRPQPGTQAPETPPVRFSPTTDRLWQVRVAAAGGALGGAAPRLELGYRPQTLAFLTRGRGPYLVAYGNASAPPTAFGERAFASVLPAGTVLTSLPPGRAGAPFDLAGADAPTPTPPFPWRRVALWSSLFAGVGGLGVLAFRLLRQLEPSER